MKLKLILFSVTFLALSLFVGCTSTPQPGTQPGPGAPPKPDSPKVAAALPDNGFKAQVELVNPPAKLRVGEKVTLQVKVRNGSDVTWFARGGEINNNPDNKFYLAAGNRWLQPDGKLVTNMDGRYGLGKDLKPGEETSVPLQVTAPNQPGEYLLEVDIVQEQVAWFSDKGSPTAKTKVTVVR